MKIKELIDFIHSKQDTSTLLNPYKEQRLSVNLGHYLNVMMDVSPQLLVLGDCPSLCACCQTGIPYVSGKELQQSFHPVLERLKKRVMLEEWGGSQVSTRVWRYLTAQSLSPLLWNAYPFHPHKSMELEQSRAMSAHEVKEGSELLERLGECFDINCVIALGRQAEQCARQAFPDVQVEYVRHPRLSRDMKFSHEMDRAFAKLREN